MRMLALNMFFVFAVLFSVAPNATENSVRNDSCEFISLLIIDGPQSGIDKMGDMFSWNQPVADKVVKLLNIMKDYKYVEGNLYVVADFGGIAEQHLLALSTKENGTQYVHLVFEQIESKLRIITIEIQDTLKDITEHTGSFPQAPEHVNC